MYRPRRRLAASSSAAAPPTQSVGCTIKDSRSAGRSPRGPSNGGCETGSLSSRARRAASLASSMSNAPPRRKAPLTVAQPVQRGHDDGHNHQRDEETYGRRAPPRYPGGWH
jgi:hypothetical protein